MTAAEVDTFIGSRVPYRGSLSNDSYDWSSRIASPPIKNFPEQDVHADLHFWGKLSHAPLHRHRDYTGVVLEVGCGHTLTLV
jgi:hypothetical protein